MVIHPLISEITRGPKDARVRSSNILKFRDKGILRLHKSYSYSGTPPLVPAGDQLQRAGNHVRRERNMVFYSFLSAYTITHTKCVLPCTLLWFKML